MASQDDDSDLDPCHPQRRPAASPAQGCLDQRVDQSPRSRDQRRAHHPRQDRRRGPTRAPGGGCVAGVLHVEQLGRSGSLASACKAHASSDL
eukprot:7390093-Prymnesium_polylepis.2